MMSVQTAHAPGDSAQAEGSKRLRILSLSCVFPNPNDEGYGIFVSSRLHAMAAQAEVRVVAPVPLLDYARLRDRSAPLPYERCEGGLRIAYPRWFYPPRGGAANAFLLAARLRAHLSRLWQRYPFQIIDAHFGHPDGVAASLLAGHFGIPFAITLRGNETMHAQARFRRQVLSFALRKAALIIALSERLKDFALEMGARREQVAIIPNGVDSSCFHLRDRASLKRQYGFAATDFVVLSAGSLIERKGHHRVIAALRANGGTNIKLVIAGGPGREGLYQTVIRELVMAAGLQDRTRMLGHVAPVELAEWMSFADVMCLASDREGWPNVVHEALACGTPVVATDVGAVPQMIVNGQNGIIVRAGDQEALSKALMLALQMSWNHEAIATGAQQRSWARVGAEVVDRFQTLVASR